MIELKFSVLTQRAPITLASPMGFQIVGSVVLTIPDKSSVASYRNYQWHINGVGVASFECNGPAQVQFQDPLLGTSSMLGPFDQLRFPNGYCYADGIRLADFARETQQWSHLKTGLRWQVLVITPANQPP